jgi:hypothetical protein
MQHSVSYAAMEAGPARKHDFGVLSRPAVQRLTHPHSPYRCAVRYAVFCDVKIVDTSKISSRAFGHSSGSERKSLITFCCIRVFRLAIVILYLLILYPALKNSDYIELLYLLQSINLCCSFISNRVVVPAKRRTGSS